MEKLKKSYFLRATKMKDYSEVVNGRKSKTPRKISQKITKKVPVYKQPIGHIKPATDVEDLYEFDSDSETVRKKRVRKKTIKTKASHNLRNKNIALEKILKDKVKLPVVIVERLNKVTFAEKLLQQSGRKNLAKNNNIQKKILTRSCNKKEKSAELAKKQVIVSTVGNNTDNNVEHEITNNQVNNLNHELKTDNNNKIDKNQIQSKIIILTDVILTPIKKSENINNNLLDTPTKFKTPNANSTMLNGSVFKPWRYNEINMKYNPHFLKVKRSALPNINQEIILDHTFSDKMNESLIKSKENNRKKEPKQKSLLNYIKTSNHMMTNEKENINTSSLFDDNEFSPIQHYNKNRNIYKNKIESVKRNILTPKTDENIIKKVITYNNSTPLHDTEENSKQFESNENNEITNFGFNSTFETENSIIANENDAKPFRITQSLVRKYQNKRKRPEIKIDKIPGSENEESSDDEQLKEVGIFVDLDDNELNSLPRKKKLKCFNDEKKSKKKIKDVLSKEEEMALNKWAQRFNSMCEEIDKHKLEVE